mgnify:CR=1 FL=1
MKPLYPVDGVAYAKAMAEAQEEFTAWVLAKKLDKKARALRVYARKMKEEE